MNVYLSTGSVPLWGESKFPSCLLFSNCSLAEDGEQEDKRDFSTQQTSAWNSFYDGILEDPNFDSFRIFEGLGQRGWLVDLRNRWLIGASFCSDVATPMKSLDGSNSKRSNDLLSGGSNANQDAVSGQSGVLLFSIPRSTSANDVRSFSMCFIYVLILFFFFLW